MRALKSISVYAAFLMMALPATQVRAAGDCEGFDPSVSTPAWRVTVSKAQTRTYFVKSIAEDARCPSPADECRQRAYLVPGDQAIAWSRKGEFVCATFVPAKGFPTKGWLAASALSSQPVAKPAVEAWIGEWRRDSEADITITRAGPDAIEISGDATWGARDPARVANGGVNIGEIEKTRVRIAADTLRFVAGVDNSKPVAEDEFACKLSVQLLDELLLVDDNGNCGGHNVSFDGIYRRH